MKITVATMMTLCPVLGVRAILWVDPLNAALEIAEINTPARASAFFGLAIHESQCFSVLEENLNYSADGLVKTFGKYFTPFEAAQYAHQPERIANRVYANRLGNGDEASGDGWLFRGRGIFQHTGRANYAHLGSVLARDPEALIKDPEALSTPDYAAMAAAEYWMDCDCNPSADLPSIDHVSDLINLGRVTPKQGDSIGFVARMNATEHALAVLTV